jgi:hypothetical protein
MTQVGVSARVPPTLADQADLTPEIQAALAALADVETRYEADRAQMEHWTGPAAWKARLCAGVEARHMRERQPLVQRLADLHREMTAALILRGPPHIEQGWRLD